MKYTILFLSFLSLLSCKSDEVTSVSQNINNSYGYLWWLNGKSSFMLPTLQTVFDGSMIPNGPNDMIMALGANDQ